MKLKEKILKLTKKLIKIESTSYNIKKLKEVV
jgi:hypothetical protein